MSSSLFEIMAAVFGSSVLSTLITSLFGRKKVDADATSAISKTVLEWANTFTQRITVLEASIADKDKRLTELSQILSKQQAEIESKNEKISELEAEVAQLRKEMTSLEQRGQA